MKKSLLLTLVVMFVASGSLYAQSSSDALSLGVDLYRVEEPSLAATAQTANSSILATSIHTSQLKDLVIDVSLECGVETITHVKSKGGKQDTDTAEASVMVRVVIDRDVPFLAREAYPGWVTFCQRKQTLSATLQGIIENLACFDETTGQFTPDAAGCVLTEEEIELGISTLSANSFNFALDNLGSGTHTIHVEAKIATDYNDSDPDRNSYAAALIGKGSASVAEVRFVKAEDGVIMP